MFFTVVNKWKKSEIPDKAKLFMTALYCWGVLIYYLSSIFNTVLRMALVYLPDSVVVDPFEYLPFVMKSDQPKPKILSAIISNGQYATKSFTNKLTMLINHKWDENIGEAQLGADDLLGGLNVSEIAKVYPNIAQALLIATYLFEKNVDKIPDEELREHVKFIFIDFAKKVIYRTEDDNDDSEKIVFGDIAF